MVQPSPAAADDPSRQVAAELSRQDPDQPSPPGTVSPYAAAQPVRISAEVLTDADPAGALAGRFLLRHSRHTRSAYAGDLAEWFTFARRLGVNPLRAKVDHADAYALLLREQPARAGRPLAPSTVQRKLSACSSFYRNAVETRVLTESPFLAVTRPKPPADSSTTGLSAPEMRQGPRLSTGRGRWSSCCSPTGSGSARRSPPSTPASHSATSKTPWATPIPTPPAATTVPAATSTATPPTPLPHSLLRRRWTSRQSPNSAPLHGLACQYRVRIQWMFVNDHVH